MFDHVELHKLYTVVIPNGITDAGVKALSVKFYEYVIAGVAGAKRTEQWANFNKFNWANPQEFLPADWNWQYSVGGRGKYVGNMARRLSKLAQVEYEVKLDAAQLAVLGQLARDNANEAETVYIDFDNKLDWSVGDFGDEGSCYWSCHRSARDMLGDHQGLGLRLWRSPEVYGKDWSYEYGYDGNGIRKRPGIGRAWVLPPASHGLGNYMLIFNGYGGTTKPNGDHTNLSTLWFARILAAFLNTDYKKIKLNNQNQWDGALWINEGNAYAIGDWLSLTDLTKLDLQWDNAYTDDDDDDEFHCAFCNWSTSNEDDIYYSDSGNEGPMCRDCYYERYTHCRHCDEEITHDEAYNAEDNDYCSECFFELFGECAKCGEYIRLDYMTTVDDDEPYCDYCLARIDAKCCDDCGNWFTEMYCVTVHKAYTSLEYRCEGCLDSHFVQCHCGNYFDPAFADDEDETRCEEHRDA